MKLIKILASLVILISLSLYSFGQEVWTLQRCIDHALEHNIQLKQSKLDVQSKSFTLKQSKLDLLPNLTGRATNNYDLGRAIDPTTNLFGNKLKSNTFSLSSSITIWDGLNKINRVKQNKLNFEASRFDVEESKDNLTLFVLTSYLQILLYQDQANIAVAQLDITKQQVERTKILVEVGKVAEGDLFEIEAQLANEELNLINAQNTYDLALLDFIQLLELESADNIIFERPSDELLDASMLESITLEGVYSNALNTQPVIKSAEFNMRSAKTGIALSRSGLWPSLSLFYGIGSNYSNAALRSQEGALPIGYVPTGDFDADLITPIYTPIFDLEEIPFNDQLSNNQSQTVGLTLNVPIFNGFAIRNAIDQSKLNLLNSEYNLDLAKNKLRKDIQQAFANATAAQKKYTASLDNVRAIEKSFFYTQEKFNLELLTAFDYNAAKNNLTKAKSELVQARYDVIFRVKILDFYQGKPLNF